MLDRVQTVPVAQPLSRDDLLGVEGSYGHQTCVDRDPFRGRFNAGSGDEHRACPALTLPAALLAAGQALSTQPFQRRGVWCDVPDRDDLMQQRLTSRDIAHPSLFSEHDFVAATATAGDSAGT
ncbi:hypothetical protein [Micromonospora sp. HUAS LYJ1]|uniref:hypothetical protein n=1 Tax=Micromonospora sp. HUAS LYJ1 TaxID=3061626 RepID=UPI0026728E0B|nr:hypothetical protein [Micromonospora sp. HUAS LYJ1]WKU08817.1 hypothetical protein Q2K16_08980 [Micromonospora sp. HUAS LYJ1]